MSRTQGLELRGDRGALLAHLVEPARELGPLVGELGELARRGGRRDLRRGGALLCARACVLGRALRLRELLLRGAQLLAPLVGLRAHAGQLLAHRLELRRPLGRLRPRRLERGLLLGGLLLHRLERLAARCRLPGDRLELRLELVGRGRALGELRRLTLDVGQSPALRARRTELLRELLGARLELRHPRGGGACLGEPLLEPGQRGGGRLELRDARLEALAQRRRLAERALCRLALGALDLRLPERLHRLVLRGLHGAAQRARLVLGGARLLGGLGGERRQPLELRRGLGGVPLGLVARDGLLLVARGRILRLGARIRQLRRGPLQARDVRLRRRQLLDGPAVLGAQLLQLRARRTRGGELLLERRGASGGVRELRRAIARLGLPPLQLCDAALGPRRARVELGGALRMRGDLRAHVATRLLGLGERALELLGACAELGRLALGGVAARGERAHLLARLARRLGLLLRARLELPGAAPGGGLQLRGARALGAQALGRRGELVRGALALGPQLGGVRLGRLGRLALAILRDLLELRDASDELLGLGAGLLDQRRLLARAR